MTFLIDSNKRSVSLSQALNLLGLLLMLISFYFIATKLLVYKGDIASLAIEKSTLTCALSAFTIVHILALNLLGIAWFFSLKALTNKAALIPSLSLYGISQIGKYLPGNIFHFAGRQLLAKQLNLPQRSVLAATACEIIGHLVSSLTLIVILLTLFFPRINKQLELLAVEHFNYLNDALLGAIVFIAFAGVYFFRRRVAELMKPLLPWNIVMYFMFHSIAGTLFVLTVNLFYPVEPEFAAVLFSVYLVSWLVGYVVPGAPGGLGVREFILVFLLAAYIPESVILASALANRLVTTLGDVGFFILAWLLKSVQSPKSIVL